MGTSSGHASAAFPVTSSMVPENAVGPDEGGDPDWATTTRGVPERAVTANTSPPIVVVSRRDVIECCPFRRSGEMPINCSRAVPWGSMTSRPVMLPCVAVGRPDGPSHPHLLRRHADWCDGPRGVGLVACREGSAPLQVASAARRCRSRAQHAAAGRGAARRCRRTRRDRPVWEGSDRSREERHRPSRALHDMRVQDPV